MSLIDLKLLSELDKQYLIKLEKRRNNFKFPKDLHLVRGERDADRVRKLKKRDALIAKTVLRKYNTLASSLFNEDGTTAKHAKKTPRQFLSNKIRRHDAQGNLLRRQLRTRDVGKMFTFIYDPKHRATLPYYDVNPVVIILDVLPDGFIGLNFHMLEPTIRLQLLKDLRKFKTLKDLETYIRITWGIIKSNNRFRFARPMLRRYLYSHTKSLIVNIPEQDWDIMQILPSRQFVNRKDTRVWLENRIKALRS